MSDFPKRDACQGYAKILLLSALWLSVRTLESSRLIERAYGQADVSSLQDSSMLAAMPPSACTTADSAQAAAMVTLDPEDLD